MLHINQCLELLRCHILLWFLRVMTPSKHSPKITTIGTVIIYDRYSRVED